MADQSKTDPSGAPIAAGGDPSNPGAPAEEPKQSVWQTALNTVMQKEGRARIWNAAARGVVTVTRAGVVPMAQAYTRGSQKSQIDPSNNNNGNIPPPAGQLTGDEKLVLAKAGVQLALEAGELLMLAFPPAPGYDVQRVIKSREETGQGQVSLAMMVSATRAAGAVYSSYSEKRAAQREEQAKKAHEEEMQSRAERLRPVSVNTLRLRGRGS